MRARATLSILLASAALALGLWTASVAAANHDLARELDDRQRRCEALEVENDRLAYENLALEERVLGGVPDPGDEAAAPEEVERAACHRARTALTQPAARTDPAPAGLSTSRCRAAQAHGAASGGEPSLRRTQ